MIQVAVNCLVKEASRKLVFDSMGCRVRRSVTPYPWRKTTCPWRTTSTATPGALLDFSEAKRSSICVDETWAQEKEPRISNVNSAVVPNRLGKASLAGALGAGQAALQELNLPVVVGLVFTDMEPLAVIVGRT